jgi:hypothetical protein
MWLAQFACKKYNIQVLYKHAGLTVNGVEKYFQNKRDS